MSTRGWEHATLHDVQHRRKAPQLPQVKSKYRNVKVVVGSETFDSKREAAYWQGLLARQRAGEIADLVRQQHWALHCPMRHDNGEVMMYAEVCQYVADFAWRDRDGVRHVADAKGVRTQLYRLKAKWMLLEHNVTIEEV